MKKGKLLFMLVVYTTLISMTNVLIGQTILSEEKGVSLSYTETYVNTIECAGSKYEQYKVVVYVKNNSGHSINIGNSWVSHNGHVTHCGNKVETAYLNARNNWSDNSTMSYTYYVAIEPGETLSINTWTLGGFRFVD